MEHFFFFAAVLWMSFVFAKLEIAIEGANGWAGNLPTWRLSPNHWVSKVFFGGKPTTGYHVWLNIFWISILHFVYLFTPFTLTVELKLWAFLFLVWFVEDFLWFLLNPAYGFKKFKKDSASWHSGQWWGIAPRDYFVLFTLGVGLYILSFCI